jgi:hypothetical protein
MGEAGNTTNTSNIPNTTNTSNKPNKHDLIAQIELKALAYINQMMSDADYLEVKDVYALTKTALAIKDSIITEQNADSMRQVLERMKDKYDLPETSTFGVDVPEPTNILDVVPIADGVE